MRRAFEQDYKDAEKDGTLRTSLSNQSKTAYFHNLGED